MAPSYCCSAPACAVLAKQDPRAPGRVTCSLQPQGKKTLGGTGRRLPGTRLPRLFVPTRRVSLTARRARVRAAGRWRRGRGEAAPFGQGRARAAPLAAPRPRTRLRLSFFRPLKGAITSQRVWCLLKIKFPGVPGEPEAPAGPGVGGEGGSRSPPAPLAAAGVPGEDAGRGWLVAAGRQRDEVTRREAGGNN